VIKSRRVRWVRHVARIGEESNTNRVLVGKLGGKDGLKHLGINERVILEWLFKE
jgi:hypothetical protein